MLVPGGAHHLAKLPHRKALLLGTAGGSADYYARRGCEQAMRVQILTGMMAYCGIPEAELHLLFGALGDGSVRERHLGTAHNLGESYFGAIEVESHKMSD